MTASAKNDTPRTDAIVHNGTCVDAVNKYREISRQLERELTAALAEAEAWKIYAGHQENCAWCADSIDDCDEGQTLRDAAIDAARSTEGKK